jgi:hypothetical protein
MLPSRLRAAAQRAAKGVTPMTESLDEALKKIREAYAQAGRDQPTEYPPLPAWEALSLELREPSSASIIEGRRDGILDELARTIRAGG